MNTLYKDQLPLEAVAPKSRVPAGAIDTHFHIFGQEDKYPLSPDRVYDPSDASVERYLRMANTLGLERFVVVNGSAYGADNSCILDAIQKIGSHRTRGVAVVEPSVSAEQLHDLYARGIRGLRFNLITNTTTMDDLKALLPRMKDVGLHAQLWVKGEAYAEILDMVDQIDVPIVLDHMGQVPTSLGNEHVYFQNLLRLLETGKVWVKLSGYRVSEGPPYNDVKVQAKEIIARIPHQCIWGTDWPHPILNDMPMPNDGELMDLLADWCEDEKQFTNVLVNNPTNLYGF